MIKSTLYISFIMMLLGFSTAHAESFTYVSKSDTTTSVGGVGPMGAYGGTYSTGSSTATSSEGKASKYFNESEQLFCYGSPHVAHCR